MEECCPEEERDAMQRRNEGAVQGRRTTREGLLGENRDAVQRRRGDARRKEGPAERKREGMLREEWGADQWRRDASCPGERGC